jgi:hypothetical protein
MRLLRQLRFSLAILTLGLQALAQCPMGTVKVRGRVEKLQTDATLAEVSVTLQTPRGSKSQTTPVSNGEFAIDVRFGTQSASYFPLWGHRCNNVPNYVDVKAAVANRSVGQLRLTFKTDFELESPFTYRLKRELTIKASNGGG